ncbi:hypothetical protein ACPPVT_06480 [Angustibacter sp. McL0619]|uniref:hypothetical protein n=1 Tax=Angustibacter sp. McL0619 TaxID=3415676 RepID=UPI003CFAB0B8
MIAAVPDDVREWILRGGRVVEEYDDGYWVVFRRVEKDVRAALLSERRVLA